MDQLPLDILLHLCSYLTKEDALKLRLLNSALSEVAASRVFREVSLYLFAFSVKRLYDLARSRHGKHVRTVTVYRDGLRVRTEAAFWKALYVNQHMRFEFVPQWPGGKPVKGRWPTQCRTCGAKEYQVYRYYLDEQKAVWAAKSRGPSLKDAFGALKALSGVQMASFDRSNHMNIERRSCQWQACPPSLATLMSLLLCFENPLKDSEGDTVTADLLEALSDAAHNISRAPVRRLTIYAPQTSSPLSKMALGPNDLEVLTKSKIPLERGRPLPQSLESLTSLTNGPTWPPAKKAAQGSLSMALLCSNLKHLNLTLSSGPDTSGHNTTTAFSVLSPFLHKDPSVWPSLQSLKLRYAWLRHKEMLPFFRSHAESLGVLSLYMCTTDDAMSLMRSIRENLSELQEIQVSWLYSWPKVWGRWGYFDKPLHFGSNVQQRLQDAEDNDYSPQSYLDVVSHGLQPNWTG